MSHMAHAASDIEELATKQFIEKVNLVRLQKQQGPLPWNTAVKFLMARKFDVDRAVVLYEQHEDTRLREGLLKLNPAADPLRTELSTGKFTILPCRDSSGAAIAVFTARYHQTHTTSHQTTLQGIVYQLDTALESLETQRCGIVFIYDMTGSLYHNFDYNLSQKILTLLKGGYPARLKKVLIVTAPLWFRAPFKVLRLFVREKLRERVYTVTSPELVNHIPAQCLPYKLGGSLEVKHEAWLLRCYESMSNRSDIYSCPTDDAPIESIEGGRLSDANNQNDAKYGNDSSQVIYDESTSGQSDEEEDDDESSLSKPMSFDDRDEASLDGEGVESDSEPFNGRDVPIELSAEEEQKLDDLNTEEQLRNIIHEVQLESARVNGHATQVNDLSFAKDDSAASSDTETVHSDVVNGFSLDEFVKYLKETGRGGLYFDYAQIKAKPPVGTFQNSRQRWNHVKNRYIDVLCYDHSRVVLEPEADDEEGQTTYINANFVDGYKHERAFINSQGPLPCTFGDFWRMIWEQRVCVVVMTTKTLERGRTKCGQYWPADQGSSVTHAHFSITNDHVVSEPNYVKTQLSVLDSRTGEERVIEHLQFTSWPDYGVPDSAIAMLGFLAKVRESQSNLTALLGDSWRGHPLGPPILVHCSAGIGRTGTFCTLDICIRRLEAEALIDVRGVVERIRNQRAFSIQMPDQYVFCHLALLEYALNTGKLKEVDLTGFENDQSDSE